MSNILIVEGRPVNRRFLASLLQDRGHRSLEAGDGEEALKIVRAEKPDLVFIDVLTAGMDACQFVLNLRSEPKLPQPQGVFRAAAYIEAEASALANAFHAFFVAKPADPDTLLAVVDAALCAPQPPPGEPHLEQRSIDALLRPLARTFHRHTANLERLNAQLEGGIAERDARLEIVRAALDQEIKKRLWAEQELTQSNHRLKDQVMHDGLTGLHNRRYLEESLGREESRARRSGGSLSIMMIDIDDFKRFNDTLGHAAGDAVLRAMGQYLLMAARGEDIVCRYGGEEFVLAMSQAPHDTVLNRAENLRN